MSVQPAAQSAANPNVDAGPRVVFLLEETIQVLEKSDLSSHLLAVVQEALDEAKRELSRDRS